MSVSNQGKIVACPNCGAKVDPLAMKCEECGYVFQRVEVPPFIREFEERVNSANFISRAGIIERFPVPNSQDALFAFIEYLQPICETAQMNPIVLQAYQSKFKECLTRAKIAFPDHPIVKTYAELDRKKKRKDRIVVTIAIVILLCFVGGGIAAVFLSSKGDKKESNPSSTTETLAAESHTGLIEEEAYTEVETLPEEEEKTAAEVKLPKGWEKVYMMSGKYEYCAAEFSCSGATFSLEIYKDGIVVNFVPKKGGENKPTNLKIGKVTDFETSDITGVATFKFYDEQEVAAIADYVSSGKNEAYVEQEGEVYKVKLSGKAAKNIIEAIKWAQANPIAMEIL